MSIEGLLRNWNTARQGLIPELQQIPAEKFDFRATPETRSVAEIARHILAVQKILVSELCRREYQFTLQSVLAQEPGCLAETAGLDKDGLIAALQSSMKWVEETIRSFGEDGLAETITKFDGSAGSKLEMLHFTVAHEMAHRGQITVYERLLGIEPALTKRFKQLASATA